MTDRPKKPYRVTFSARSHLWTIWKRTSAWMYPIAINRSLPAAWKEAAENPLHGKAFR